MAEVYADSISKLQVQCMMPATAAFPRQVRRSEEPKLSLVERLDKAIFPEDPIRDWTERQVKAIDEHFDKLLECLQNV